MSTTGRPSFESFTMNGLPLLESGLDGRMLANAEQLWVQSRIYASGGENTLHEHPNEDHAFFVLAGEATFYDEAGESHVARPYDGVMIPRGARYRFQATSEENLVILRIGAGHSIAAKGRESNDGTPVRSAGRGVPAVGHFFGS